MRRSATVRTVWISTPFDRRTSASSSRRQFPEGKWLREIVVAPSPQAPNAIVDLGQRAKYQDRRLVPCLAQDFDDAEAIGAAGQHAVEDHHVVLAAGREKETIATIIGMVDNVTFLEQPLADELGHSLIVFDEENFHSASSARPERCNTAMTRPLLPRRQLQGQIIKSYDPASRARGSPLSFAFRPHGSWPKPPKEWSLLRCRPARSRRRGVPRFRRRDCLG